MRVQNHEQQDVVVLGGGITGLMLTAKLAQLGVRTLLLEQGPTFAGGPSTRNEGWLHRGTYHATSIREETTALQVARRCIYGHGQIRAIAPEAVEDIDSSSFALTHEKERIAEIEERWQTAGVIYRKVSRNEFMRSAPEVDISNVAAAYEVADKGIDTRVLYGKLLAQLRRNGATAVTGAQISSFETSNTALVQYRDSVQKITANTFVYATGYGTRQTMQQLLGIDLPLRYWKSHLYITSRLSRPAVFSLDPQHAAMMNHGEFSIVGLNEDAVESDVPDNKVIDARATLLKDSVAKLFQSYDPSAPGRVVACIKTDLAEKTGMARSLAVSISEPTPGHISVLPGKMTEAPYVTDVLTRFVYNRIGDSEIAFRPMDAQL